MDTGGQDDKTIETRVRDCLAQVIAPDVGLAVTRMGCVRDLRVHGGHVSLVFRPSSSVCPAAFHLASMIQQAVRAVPGVCKVTMQVENFDRAHELASLLADQEEGGPGPAGPDE